MTTTEIVRHKAARPAYFKLTTGEADGTFEAIVAVFGNVDLGGDRILPGAFTASLDRWKAAGDPIPVIFSHRWDDLDAHIGVVTEAKEVGPGDPLIPADAPDEVKAGGGLYVKGRLDVDEDYAGRVWKRMKRRSIKEFSFAYDIPPTGARRTADAFELIELDLIEVGPTLKGMNPATALIDAKAARALIKDLDPGDALDLLDGLIPPPPPGAAKADVPAGAKRLPGGTPAGSLEETLNAIRSSAQVWAGLEYGSELYYLHLEATYLDDRKAIVTAERWSDPFGEGPVWALDFELDADGAVIKSATELELELNWTPKAGAKAAKQRAAAAAMLDPVALAHLATSKSALASVAIVPPDTATTTAKSDEEPSGAKSDEELEAERLTPGSVERELADLDLEV